MDGTIAADSARAANPRGARSLRRAVGVGAVLGLAGAGMLLAAVRIANGSLSYPGCGFKNLTGLACPGCGGVRSLNALVHGGVVEAFALNPMACLLVLGLVLAMPIVLLDAAIGRGRIMACVAAIGRHRLLAWMLGGVVLANWIYLLAVGR